MASVEFKNVCVDYPIYNSSARSLKKSLMRVATGGQLGADAQGHVIVRAIDDLTLKLGDGDRLGLVGHNGSGKSTLLRVLAGVYAPSSGTAEIRGDIGSLIDISLGIDPEATGRENIYLRGSLLGMTNGEIARHLDDIINFSELGEFIDMPLRTYSTGMHLRLAFAVSTTVRPQILLMDEWLSVGDDHFRQKAEVRMAELLRATSILVIATHSKELVLDTCNRAIWLEHGRVRLEGSAEDVCAAYFG
jgi:lipopolysaccharide transport system ATP-binding protein